MAAVNRFDKPILVGHSFSGMFPLLFPALESKLSGFICLNAAPHLWFSESEKKAKEHNLKSQIETAPDMSQIRCQEEFNNALLACLPYYFREHAFDAARKLLNDYTFNYKAALWWMKKVGDINFNATWIPQTVPTLLLGSSHDISVPFSCFQNDKRFQRDNIRLVEIDDAGHFPWIEHCNVVADIINDFAMHFSA